MLTTALVVGSYAGTVAAQTLQVTLDYATDTSLEGCPGEPAFRKLVEAQLGHDPFRDGAEYRVSVRAQRGAGGVTGSVRWQHVSLDVGGERQLSDQSCHDLVQTMAFAVAVQLQLYEAGASGNEPQEPPEHEPPSGGAADETVRDDSSGAKPDASAPATASPAPNSKPGTASSARGPEAGEGRTTDHPWATSLGMGMGVRLRRAPEFTPEARFFATAGSRVLEGELAVGGTWPRKWDANAVEGFRYWSAWASGAACARGGNIVGCVVGRLERLAAKGFGVDEPRSSSAWLTELGPRFAVFVEATPEWRASMYVEARAQLVPARVILDAAQVYETPPWSLTFGVDISAVWRQRR